MIAWIWSGDAHERAARASQHELSNATVTDLVAVCAAVLGLALYCGLILAPAWSSYTRLWERLAATVLSLYVLGVLVGSGVLGALLIVYVWG